MSRPLSPPQAIVLIIVVMLALTALAIRVRFLGQQPTNCILIGLFITAFVLSAFGALSRRGSTAETEFGELRHCTDHSRLFILVHGLDGGEQKTWSDVLPLLEPMGDTLALNYDAGPFANSDPLVLAKRMSDKIQSVQTPYQEIVLVAHSMGALLARRAYLISAQTPNGWAAKTTRIVLLAGLNRGWTLDGPKPLDMTSGRRLKYGFGAWFGELTHTGRLVLDTRRGSAFVSNLRLDWMEHFRDTQNTPLVVQLLGDIDDVVSEEDDKDIRVAVGKHFYWLRVRGTDHSAIVDFHDRSDKNVGYEGIGPYRMEKFLLALQGQPAALQAECEDQPLPTDPSIKHVVFVLHGIRDLGGWAADFESQLRSNTPAGGAEGLRVVSLRYGYFSMASFLFRPDRQHYVRWFMDQYTDTLARYPNANQIDFIGHSNGTYLLASALSQYSSLKLRRIALAGSVVRTDYDWVAASQKHDIEAIWNYVGEQDAVVAVFPRFFEPRSTYFLFRNDVGSAGFNGFDQFEGPAAGLPAGHFANIPIEGGHSAFLAVAGRISNFLMAPCVPPLVAAAPEYDPSGASKVESRLLHLHSTYAFWLLWIGLAFVIGFPAVRLAVAGGEYAWIPLTLYGALVLSLLSRL